MGTSGTHPDPPPLQRSERHVDDAPGERAAGGMQPVGPAAATIACASAAAAVVHFAMFPAHLSEDVLLGVGFALAGWFQLVCAGAVLLHPSRRLLALMAAGNAVLLGAWAVSRTVGLPLGSHTGAEDVATVDALCATAEAVVLGASLVALRRWRRAVPKGPATSDGRLHPVAAVVLPCAAALLATTAALAAPGGHGGGDGGEHGHGAAEEHPHDDGAAADEHALDEHGGERAPSDASAGHDDEHDEAHGAAATTGSSDLTTDPHAGGEHAPEHDGDAGQPAEHGHTATGVEHAEDSSAHADPEGEASGEHDHDTGGDKGAGDIGAGHPHECTATPTASEQYWADGFVFATELATSRFVDFDVAVAEGYVPITPPSAQLVHYARLDYMADGVLLDPERVESLMYARGPDGRKFFVGTMYWNDITGTTGPTPGGCITQWHVHTNLCIAPGVGMVGVVRPDGSCPPGSTNEETGEMMHVWTVPLPDGPFSHSAAPADLKAGVKAKYF